MGLLIDLPIIPIPMNWENSTANTALMNKASYGKGNHVERRRSTVVKTDMGAIAVDIAIDNRDEVLNFLVGRAGRSFRTDPLLNGNPTGKAWRCMEFTFNWVAPGLWMFAAEFKEVGGRWI